MASQVMIVGCGRLGAMVAEALLERGNTITVIDTDPENFRRLRERDGLHTIVADGTSNEDLRRSGIEQADVFLSLAAQDAVNALAGQSARITFGIDRVVCRINDPTRREMYEGMGLRTISPSRIMTDLVLQSLEQ